MPPWTCCVVAAIRAPASAAQNFAIAGRPIGRPTLRDQPGRVPGGPADRLQVDESVGHPLLHRLEATDRTTELLTAAWCIRRPSAARGRTRRPGWRTGRPARGCRATRPGASPSSLSVAAETVGAVQKYIGVRFAVGGRHRPDLDAGRIGRQQEQPSGSVVDRRGDQHGVGELAERDQLFDAVQPPRVAVAAGGGGRRGRVGAAGLVQTRGQDAAAVDDPGQEALLLFGIPVPSDRVGAQQQRRVGGHRRHRRPDFGQQHAEFDEATAVARPTTPAMRCPAGPDRPVPSTARRRSGIRRLRVRSSGPEWHAAQRRRGPAC